MNDQPKVTWRVDPATTANGSSADNREKTSNISRALMRLDDSIERLDNAAYNLFRRIEMVLGPEIEQKSIPDDTAAPMASSMTDRLLELSRRVDALVTVVSETSERVEL